MMKVAEGHDIQSVHRVELLEDEAEFSHLRKEWNELLAKAAHKSLFLTWEWMYTWWSHYSRRHPGLELKILLARDYASEKLQGIAPLYLHKRHIDSVLPFRELRFLGTEFESSDYLDFILDRDHAAETRRRLMNKLLENVVEADQILLDNVPENSHLKFYFDHCVPSPPYLKWSHPRRICPFILLPASIDDYLQGLSRSWRSFIRRKSKQLWLKESEFDLEVLKTPAEIEEALPELFELHRLRFASKGQKTKFYKQERITFHLKVAPLLATSGNALLFFIRHKKRRIAGQYCFLYDGRLMYYQGGFDPRWSRLDVGTLLFPETISYAISHGCRVFDFMRGAELYKFHWTKTYLRLYELGIAFSRRARWNHHLDSGFSTIKSSVKRWLKPSSKYPFAQ